MDWYTSVFELIDMRSFSNLWFWIVLAVIWSTVNHWVLGVPWDMVMRARDNEGQAQIDLEDMVRIHTNRLLYIVGESGLLLTGFACFLFTFLGLTGFVYGHEFAQAVFLLGVPMSIVGLLSIFTARAVRSNELSGEALIKRLGRHRLYTRMIGVASIFITAMWGMYQNMSASALGG